MKAAKNFFIYLGLAVIALIVGVKACYLVFEVKRTKIDNLRKEEINSIQYPWSIKKGVVTSVKNYKEVYDIDSNHWIAEFWLLPSEAQNLSGQLQPLSPEKMNYGCAAHLANWDLKYDVCKASEMHSNGFTGYFHNPSFCEAGCKQDVILWVHKSGRSFIVGSPDYD